MALRIPPPIMAMIFGIAIYLTGHLFPEFYTPYNTIYAILSHVSGVFLIALSIRKLRSIGTTISPINIKQTSSLVTDGTYQLSRNPMYLGLTLNLAAISLWFNMLGGLFLVIIFVCYLNRFQINHEETVMNEKFGDKFIKYKNRVGRWF